MKIKTKIIIIIITLIILLGIIFTLWLCTQKTPYEFKIITIEPELKECTDKSKVEEYYTLSDSKIYKYCFIEILVQTKQNNEVITLKEALDKKNITMDNIINELKMKDALNDGGTTIYTSDTNTKIVDNNLKIIKCNTVDGNKDYYIGNKNLEKQENFCKNNQNTLDNQLFTRTYTVLNIYMSDDIQKTYITIKEFQGELETVLVPTNIIDFKENTTYEFTFKLTTNKIEDNIKSIFNNLNIVEVKKTSKTGLGQIQEPIPK